MLRHLILKLTIFIGHVFIQLLSLETISIIDGDFYNNLLPINKIN